MATPLSPSSPLLRTRHLLWCVKHCIHAPDPFASRKRILQKFIQQDICGAPVVLPPGQLLFLVRASRPRCVNWRLFLLRVRPHFAFTTRKTAAVATPFAPLGDPAISFATLPKRAPARRATCHRQLFVFHYCFSLWSKIGFSTLGKTKLPSARRETENGKDDKDE